MRQIKKNPQISKQRSIFIRIRDKVKRGLLQAEMPFVNLGKFRLSGEVHQWMYDKYSLSLLQKTVGFEQIRIVDAFSSNIAGWKEYSFLDVEDGKPRKPDSLFMEAVK